VIEREDFLVEIGTEELPPKILLALSNAFLHELKRGFRQHNLDYREATAYATSRRLAVQVSELAVRQEDQNIERRGPALDSAFDKAGNPTKAAIGFASSCGVAVEKLGYMHTDKGKWLSYSAKIDGKQTHTLLPKIVEKALNTLPVPRPMRWGSGATEFVRPVHWIVMLLGPIKVKATIFGVETSINTRGHRFHAPEKINIESPKDYSKLLEESGYVIADFGRRRDRIRQLATEIAGKNNNHVIINEDLLNEVTALVEWPAAICGSFDEKFLALPREVLIASMQDHQKYFPVESVDGALTNKFVAISNIESLDPSTVRRGNERVIRPRLSDAVFFWEQDKKSRLEDHLYRLQKIVYQNQLGSIKDKTDRVVTLARSLAPEFGAEADHTARAALLSRCDLVTEMVGDFPNLQGLMGSYYATADGEPQQITDALREFYMPRFSGDSIPTSPVGCCIAYADRLDTLVGIFAIGSVPTGDKDPFALRRAALGCFRIALESNSNVGLFESLQLTCDGYGSIIDANDVLADVADFIVERARGYFIDQQIPASVIESVLATSQNNPADIQRRISAVTAFRALTEANALASANKRIANILRKNSTKTTVTVSDALLKEPAERVLVEHINSVSELADDFIQRGDHTAYLKALAGLHDPINLFFDEVMVMCDDIETRDNRIALLTKIRKLFTRVADVAYLNE